MTFEELIEAAEKLVKSSREKFTKGHLEAAKLDLLNVASKIISTLPGPVEQRAPTPGRMRW